MKVIAFARYACGKRWSHCAVNASNDVIESYIDNAMFLIARLDMPEEAWWLVASSSIAKPIGPFDTPERAYAQLRLLGS
jgi:hypothetical protein